MERTEKVLVGFVSGSHWQLESKQVQRSSGRAKARLPGRESGDLDVLPDHDINLWW